MDDTSRHVQNRSRGELLDMIMTARTRAWEITVSMSQRYYTPKERERMIKRISKHVDRAMMLRDEFFIRLSRRLTPFFLSSMFSRKKELFEQFLRDRYYFDAWRSCYVNLITKKYISPEDMFIMIEVHDMPKKFVEYIASGDFIRAQK